MPRKTHGSATKKGPIHYTPCRIRKGYAGAGQFYESEFCGVGKRRKKKVSKKRKGKGRKKTTKRKKPSGYYRDRGGNCRKKGKRGFAKESACKRAGK